LQQVPANGATEDHGYAAFEALLAASRPDAIYCSGTRLAAGVLRCCRDAGLSVPGDVSVVAEGSSRDADSAFPGLTCTASEIGALARELVTMLRDLAASGKPAPGVFLPVTPFMGGATTRPEENLSLNICQPAAADGRGGAEALTPSVGPVEELR
jgi:DNA-binding LacI/PurR family transcriptional regulator